MEHIALVAPTKMSVLVLGESGTGKEFAARLIHQKSNRSAKVFYAVDCGALSKELAASELFGHIKGAFTGAINDKKGAFEKASGGTLFLDEVGNLSYDVQVQLLRALQEQVVRPVGGGKDVKVDVRIVAATNEHLTEYEGEKTFRLDLYHRLNEFTLFIPALKDRGEDLHVFINHFLERAALELELEAPEIDEEVWKVLGKYTWPGNLRELKNIIRRAVLLSRGHYISLAHIPEEIKAESNKMEDGRPSGSKIISDTTDLKQLKSESEKEMITRVLQEAKYNKTKTASILNIDRKTLYSKLKKYGIDG